MIVGDRGGPYLPQAPGDPLYTGAIGIEAGAEGEDDRPDPVVGDGEVLSGLDLH